MCLFNVNIKIIKAGLILLALSAGLKAQLYPLPDQYLDNAIILNPALAGNDEALSITLLYRNQWLNMVGAPKTTNLIVHAPLNTDRIGLGFLLQNDSYGIHRNTKIGGNYAYRLKLKKGLLAFGLSASITNRQNAWKDLISVDMDDQQLIQNDKNYIIPNFGFGAYYEAGNFFGGVSIPELLFQKWDNTKDKYSLSNNISYYNLFALTGYIISISESLKFTPSTLIRYNRMDNLQFDLNSQITYQNSIGIVFAYRREGNLTGMLKCKVNNQAFVSYSYGYATNNNFKTMGGTHEIGLKYIFKYNLEVSTPR